MNDKAFRLDFFIAVGALVMNIITTAALVYQTHVVHDSYAVALWPYVGVETNYGWTDGSGIEVSVRNDGFGPALIHSAQLSVDGKPVTGWKEYAQALLSDPIIKRLKRGSLKGETGSAASIDGSTIVRSGDSKMLLRIHAPYAIPQRLFNKHKIALDFCYCSLNGSCWTLHSEPGAGRITRPLPVPDCTGDAAIRSDIY